MTSLRVHFCRRSYLFKFKLGFFLLCLFFFFLCCLLGTWQLHRYQFKKQFIFLYEQRQQAIPQAFSSVLKNNAHLQFLMVKASGRYLNEQTVLQSRVRQGQMGYEVLTPFQMDADKNLLLVDRGWIPKTSQQVMENITGEQLIEGSIKVLNEYQFILGKNKLSEKPLMLQKIDMAEISQAIHQPFYPFILRLSASQPHGFLREENIQTVLPQRHMAYAIQWFALAFILLIAYVCFCYERKDDAAEK